MCVGQRIRKIRLERNLKQADLAIKTNISRVSIGNYERGDRIPNADALKAIANALNVSVNDLIYDDTLVEPCNSMNIGDTLKQKRKIAKLTQKELADKSGISISYIQQLEYGMKENPGIEVLRSIANALNVSINDLLYDDDPIEIGRNIRKERKLKGLTMKELGHELGISEQAISQYERNIRTPNTKTLLKIAKILNISVYELDSSLKSLFEHFSTNSLDLTSVPTNDLIKELIRRLEVKQ